MFTPTNWLGQWAQLNQVQFDRSLRLAVIGLDGVEKMLILQLRLWKGLCSDTEKTFKAMRGASDEEGLVTLKDQLAQPSLEKVLATSRAIYETLAELQGEFTKAAEDVVEASLAAVPPPESGSTPSRRTPAKSTHTA